LKRYLSVACTALTAIAGSARGATVIVDGTQVVTSGDAVAVINGKVYQGGNAVPEASGALVSETRQVGAFSEIGLSIAADATFRVAPKPRITVVAQSDLLPRIRTTVRGHTLVIAADGAYATARRIKLMIEGPALDAAEVSGAGALTASGVRGDALRLGVSGSGSIMADGAVERVSVDVSGAGSVDALGLRAKAVSIDVSGAGSVAAYASDAADIDTSGAASVRIAGNPARRHVGRRGAGVVRFE